MRAREGRALITKLPIVNAKSFLIISLSLKISVAFYFKGTNTSPWLTLFHWTSIFQKPATVSLPLLQKFPALNQSGKLMTVDSVPELRVPYTLDV